MLERWRLAYEPHTANPSGIAWPSFYKRFIVLLRALTGYLRLMPAHRLAVSLARLAPTTAPLIQFRISVGHAPARPAAAHRVDAAASGADDAEAAELAAAAAAAEPPLAFPRDLAPRQHAFSPPDTSHGKLRFSVAYRPPGLFGRSRQHAAPAAVCCCGTGDTISARMIQSYLPGASAAAAAAACAAAVAAASAPPAAGAGSPPDAFLQADGSNPRFGLLPRPATLTPRQLMPTPQHPEQQLRGPGHASPVAPASSPPVPLPRSPGAADGAEGEGGGSPFYAPNVSAFTLAGHSGGSPDAELTAIHEGAPTLVPHAVAAGGEAPVAPRAAVADAQDEPDLEAETPTTTPAAAAASVPASPCLGSGFAPLGGYGCAVPLGGNTSVGGNTSMCGRGGLDDLPFLMDDEMAFAAPDGEGGGHHGDEGAGGAAASVAMTKHEAVLGSFIDEVHSPSKNVPSPRSIHEFRQTTKKAG